MRKFLGYALSVLGMVIFLPLSALSAGNQPVNTLPDSNKATFRVDSQNFWKQELPNILSRHVNEDFIVSGTIHSTSPTCSASGVEFEGFTRRSDRVVTSGPVTINYGAANIGGNCASDVCWVAGGSSDAASLPGSNFQRVGSSKVYVNCATDSPPTWPEDGTRLMKVTLSGGAITQVDDLRQPSSFARKGTYDITDPLYGAACDGNTQTAAAIQRVFDTAPIGATVVLPEGTCILNAPVTINKPLRLTGAGIGLTQLRSLVASQPVLVIDSQLVTASGFFVTHAGLSPVAGGDGLVVKPFRDAVYLSHILSQFNWRGFVLGSIAYASATHLTASLNNSHGFEFVYDGFGGNQWDVSYSKSENNKGGGFVGNVGTFAQGLGPFLTMTTSFLNTQGGYIFQGSPGHTLFDLRLNNVLSSYDNGAGIFLETYGGSHIIDNPWVEFTGMAGGGLLTGADLTPHVSVPGHCVVIGAHNGPGLTLNGGNYINCGWSAIAIDANFVSVVGGTSYDYGAALVADPIKRAGVVIGGSNVLVSGHSFDYHAAFPINYIYLKGSPVGVSIGHNTYNPALDPSQYLGVAGDANISGSPPHMVAGLAVHTNKVGAPALTIYDATNGPTPLKGLLVANGALEVRNSTGSQILHNLTDSGTPGWPQRRGQLTISGTNTSANVVFAVPETNVTFFVQLTAVSQTGAPALGAFTVQGVSKATTNFVVTILAPPGVGNSITYDWFVYR